MKGQYLSVWCVIYCKLTESQTQRSLKQDVDSFHAHAILIFICNLTKTIVLNVSAEEETYQTIRKPNRASWSPLSQRRLGRAVVAVVGL